MASRMEKKPFRVFLSFPGSAADLAVSAHEAIAGEARKVPWCDRADVQIGRWNDPDHPCTWPTGVDPNEPIWNNLKGNDADLFVLCLTSTIGNGTIDEVRRRLGAKGEVLLFHCDRPPAKSDFADNEAAYDHAYQRYRDLNEWIRSPFYVDGEQRVPLGGPIVPVRVQDAEELARNLSTHIVKVLTEALFSHQKRTANRRALIYSGLMPLAERHAPFFFGRSREIEDICEKIKWMTGVMLLSGASGTGKSSLMGAGVVPELRKRDATGQFETLPIVKPEKDPFGNIAKALYPALDGALAGGRTPREFENALSEEPASLLDQEFRGHKKRIILVIDQFEQIYTSSEDDIELVGRLLDALAAQSKVTTVLVHRADRLGNWHERTFLQEADDIVHVEVRSISHRNLADVIEKPIIAARETYQQELEGPEPDLVNALLEEFSPRQGRTSQLPLLAKALQALFKESRYGKFPMTLETYKRLGGIQGIMRDSADSADKWINRYKYASQLPLLFEMLVDVTEMGEPVSVSAPREKLIEAGVSAELIEELQSLFFLTGQGEAGDLTLAHEKYFEFWPQLKLWVDDNRERLRSIREVTIDAERWQEQRRTPSRLLRGDQLENAERIMSERGANKLDPRKQALVAEYVEASRNAADVEDLQQAMIEGENAVILRLLEKGAKPPQPEPDNRLAPFYDAIWGSKESDNEIRTPNPMGILNGRTLQYTVLKGFTPLHYAALAGRLDKIQKLLVLGAQVDVESDGGATPLMLAAYGGHIDAVKLLLQLGADPAGVCAPSSREERSFTASHWASLKGHNEIVELLDTASTSGSGPIDASRLSTLLEAAASGGNIVQLERRLQELRDHPEIDEQTRVEMTTSALLYAANGRHAACVRALMANGARPSGMEHSGAAILLLLGTKVDNIELDAEILGDMLSAEPSCALAKDDNMSTPLHAAAQRGERLLVEKIAEHCEDLDPRNNKNATPLHWAAALGHSECIEVLLTAGADPNLQDLSKDTPLIDAARQKNEDAALMLLDDPKTDTRVIGGGGRTALIHASLGGLFPTVEKILSLGSAELNYVDKAGHTALTNAIEASHREITSLLVDHGARLPVFTRVRAESGRSTAETTDASLYLQRLEGDELRSEIQTQLREPLEVWPVPPLISHPDHWRAQTGERALAYTLKLAAHVEEEKLWLNIGPITAVRTLPLLCYANGELVELLTETFDGKPALLAFIIADSGMRLLNGTSPPLHSLNVSDPPIDLSEPENVIQFLRLYCVAVQGDNGPFQLVDSMQDVPWSDSMPVFRRDSLSSSIRRMSEAKFDDAADTWLVNATVLYGNGLFHAEFKVFKSGYVEMTDDDPIAADIALRISFGFNGFTRTCAELSDGFWPDWAGRS